MDEDGNQWELSKENIQPIKEGRSVGSLMTALDDNSQLIISRQRNEYETELRAYLGSDPLDVWYRYSLWVEQSFPNGGKASNLKSLIQKCFIAINSDAQLVEKYSNDPRFLQLWLKYASMIRNPLEVFEVLEARGWFRQLAELYKNWASEMEVSGNMKQADIIYQQGLVNAKDCTLLLKEAHSSFQSRMFIAALSRKTEDNSDEEAGVHHDKSHQNQRLALSSLKVVKKNHAPTERVVGATLGSAGRLVLDDGPSGSEGVLGQRNVQFGKVPVYQDENVGAIGGHAFLTPSAPATGRLPAVSHQDKENSLAPTKWKAKTLQSAVPVNVPLDQMSKFVKPSIAVFEDADVEQPFRPTVIPDGHGLKEWKSAAVLQQATNDTTPLFIAEPFNPLVQPQYDKHKVYQGMEEFSFEELRALSDSKQLEEERKEEEKRRREEAEKEKLAQLSQCLKKKDEVIDSMKHMLEKHEEMLVKLLTLQQSAVTDQWQQQAQQLLTQKQVGGAGSVLFEDSWVAVNRSTGPNSTSLFCGDTSTLPQHLLDESSARVRPAPSPTAGQLTTPAGVTMALSAVSLLCAPPDISQLPELSLMEGEDHSPVTPEVVDLPNIVVTKPSPLDGSVPAVKPKGLSMRPIIVETATFEAEAAIEPPPPCQQSTALDPAVTVAAASEVATQPQQQRAAAAAVVATQPQQQRAAAAAVVATQPQQQRAAAAAVVATQPQQQRAAAAAVVAAQPKQFQPKAVTTAVCPPPQLSTRPKVVATDGFIKPSTGQRSMMDSPTINTKEAARCMKEVWSVSLDLSKTAGAAVWDNVLGNDDKDMPPPPLPHTVGGAASSAPAHQIFIDNPSPPLPAPPVGAFTISYDEPPPATRLKGKSLGGGLLGQYVPGQLSKPTRFSECPVGLYQQPSVGLGVAPVPESLELPAFGRSEASSSVCQDNAAHEIIAYSASQLPVKSTSGVIASVEENEPPVGQNENMPPPDYVIPHGSFPRRRRGVLQPLMLEDLPRSDDEDCKVEEDKDEDALCMEIDDMKPLPASPPSMEPTAVDASISEVTMKLPDNQAAFAGLSHVASTPGAWVMNSVPQPHVDGDEFTLAFMPGYRRTTFRQLPCHDVISNEGEPPCDPLTRLSPTAEPAPAPSHPVPAQHQHPDTRHGGVGGQLSAIMEGSAEHPISRSASSCTSACVSTAPSHHQAQLFQQGDVSVARTTVDYSRSGYTADRSSLTTTITAVTTNTTTAGTEGALPAKTVVAKTKKQEVPCTPAHGSSGGDDSFDPDKLSEMLMNMSSGAPSVLAAAVATDAGATDAHFDMEKQQARTQPHEPLQVTGNVDPFSEDLLDHLLCHLSVPLTARPGFTVINAKMPLIKTQTRLPLGTDVFHVRRLRGQGAYAKVFQASTVDPMNVTALPTTEDAEEDDDESQMILKVQRPAWPWEFYICHELRERLKESGRRPHELEAVMRVNRGYFFTTGSILATEYHRYGTLLDVVNEYKKKGIAINESLALYFMIEVLNILEYVHACDIIHADVKPDNFLVRALPVIQHGATTHEQMFCSVPVALKLIDFGRSIDLRLLPKGTAFTRMVTTEGFTCCEMQEGKPWTFQPDLYGAAAIAHALLWGTYMTVARRGGGAGEWGLQGVHFKRYWNQEAWQTVFHQLLNVPSCDELPDLAQIRVTLQRAFFDSGKRQEFQFHFTELGGILRQSRS